MVECGCMVLCDSFASLACLALACLLAVACLVARLQLCSRDLLVVAWVKLKATLGL